MKDFCPGWSARWAAQSVKDKRPEVIAALTTADVMTALGAAKCK